MITKTLKCKLVATQDNSPYTIYVFRDLDTLEYFMCCRFPNWETRPLQINEEGYVEYRIVIAGKDHWYDKINDVLIPYKYDGYHFINFVPICNQTNEIIIKK